MPYGKVLIVDDVETNLYVAKGLMMPYQLDIETVTSGFMAIDLVNEGNIYDIIFMDHMMPKMNGIETTKKLRDAGYTSPIVALTANAVVGQAEVFYQNGFDEFISKPIDIRQLNTILNKLIRDKQPPEVLEVARQQGESVTKAPEQTSNEDVELRAIFAREAEEALKIINDVALSIETASDSDILGYVVKVHAMKSSLAYIGEHEAANFANMLEKAGNEQNRTIIQTETPTFNEIIQLILSTIDVPSDDDTISVDSDTELLREKLKLITDACDEYDDQTVEAVLAELKKNEWSKETRSLLSKIADCILHSEFEAAVEAVTQYQKR
jgi:CheY-like chemotaxis protein